ncbi:hypothetical protein E3N88_02086 [Mikania micrantha]|uniref:Uncharacterized protein n=1 Tax=Mikania micrantha TaxID=192012 RepID=A0A5N6Q5I1_9ASTR|nr:hypothetical protein E3N88_02086 [Mikania micrantha]
MLFGFATRIEEGLAPEMVSCKKKWRRASFTVVGTSIMWLPSSICRSLPGRIEEGLAPEMVTCKKKWRRASFMVVGTSIMRLPSSIYRSLQARFGSEGEIDVDSNKKFEGTLKDNK